MLPSPRSMSINCDIDTEPQLALLNLDTLVLARLVLAASGSGLGVL